MGATLSTCLKVVPIVPHIVALGALIVGKNDMAKEYWDSGNQALSSMVNAVPVIGHVKGVIHHICGDREGAIEAYLAASRTTCVMIAGAGGFMVAGPVGAACAGIAAGAAWDGVAYYATDGKTKRGIIKIVITAYEDPTDGWSLVKGGLEIIGDGMTGYAGGKIAERVVRASEIKTASRYLEKRREIVADNQKLTKTASDGTIKTINRPEVYAEAKDMTNGKLYSGSNKGVRSAMKDPTPPEGNKFLIDNKYKNSTCAEPQALNKFKLDNPTAEMSEVRMNTVEMKNGNLYPKEACGGCQKYQVGTVNTDPQVSI